MCATPTSSGTTIVLHAPFGLSSGMPCGTSTDRSNPGQSAPELRIVRRQPTIRIHVVRHPVAVVIGPVQAPRLLLGARHRRLPPALIERLHPARHAAPVPPPSKFQSSHCSVPITSPSPQVTQQTLGAVPEHVYPVSTVHPGEHPSPLPVFPSSHTSAPPTTPSPHTGPVLPPALPLAPVPPLAPLSPRSPRCLRRRPRPRLRRSPRSPP